MCILFPPLTKALFVFEVKSKANSLMCHSHTRNHGWNNISMSSDTFLTADKVIIQRLRNKFGLSCFLNPPPRLNQSFLCFMALWYIEIYSVMGLSFTHETLYFNIILANWPPSSCWRNSTVDCGSFWASALFSQTQQNIYLIMNKYRGIVW